MLFSLIIQLHYLLFIYRKLIVYRKNDVKPDTEPVSVIICARNEADNLKKFLPAVLNQFYPDFEVIVVNDGSTDETAEVLSDLKTKYPQLYVTGIEPREGYSGGKKLAQTIGIKAAHNDQLLFIDADCEPAGPNWIRQMQSNFLRQTDIVLGFGAYHSQKGWLNKWIRIDTVYIAMQYISYAIHKQAFMGVGRNLAYRKSLFIKNRGHASHLHIASGDDDLFINETTTPFNTRVELHPESFTYSLPQTRWKNWVRQKKRHLSSSRVYKKSNKRRLGTEVVSRELFFLSAGALLLTNQLTGYAIIALAIRLIIFGIIFKLVMNRLKEKKLFLFSFVYDILWPFIGAYLMLSTKLKRKPTKWK